MKHTLINQARRAGGAFVAVMAVAAFGIGAAQAQSFAKADLSVNAYGFLDCSFKETGLAGGASVDYTCGATDIGWIGLPLRLNPLSARCDCSAPMDEPTISSPASATKA